MNKLILFILLLSSFARAQTCTQETLLTGTLAQTVVPVGSAFNVSCDYGPAVGGTDAVRVDYPTCHWTSWTGEVANFTCTAESYAASYPISCLLVQQNPNYFCPQANYIGSVSFVIPQPTPTPPVNPNFTFTGATSPGSLVAGSSIAIDAAVTVDQDITDPAIVIYATDPLGNQYTYVTVQTLLAGAQQNIVGSIPLPNIAVAGLYGVSVNIFYGQQQLFVQPNFSTVTVAANTNIPVGTSACQFVMNMSWLPVPIATGYKIYYGNTSGGPYPNVIDVGNVLQYPVANLCAGTYYFVVSEYNPGGESNKSVEVIPTYTATVTESFVNWVKRLFKNPIGETKKTFKAVK